MDSYRTENPFLMSMINRLNRAEKVLGAMSRFIATGLYDLVDSICEGFPLNIPCSFEKKEHGIFYRKEDYLLFIMPLFVISEFLRNTKPYASGWVKRFLM